MCHFTRHTAFLTFEGKIMAATSHCKQFFVCAAFAITNCLLRPLQPLQAFLKRRNEMSWLGSSLYGHVRKIDPNSTLACHSNVVCPARVARGER